MHSTIASMQKVFTAAIGVETMVRRSRRAFLHASSGSLSLAIAGCLSRSDAGVRTPFPGVQMAQYDAGHTAHRPDTSGPTGDVTPAWEHHATNGVGDTATQPVIANGTVIYGVPGDPGAVVAVDARSGEERWRRSAESGLDSIPAIHDDRVIVTGGESLTALSIAEGTPEWSVALGDRGETPTVADGIVYLTTTGGTLRAVDAADGTEVWTIQRPDEEFRQGGPHEYRADRGDVVSVADDVLVHRYTGETHELVARSVADGGEAWRTDVHPITRPVVHDGHCYCLDVYGTIRGFALDSGAASLDVSVLEPGVPAGGIAVAEDTIYVTEETGQLNAVGRDGSRGWSVQNLRPLRSTPIVVDGTIYAASMSYDPSTLEDHDAALYAGSTEGDVRTVYEVPGPLSAPVAFDGTVYVGVAESSNESVRMVALRAA